MKGIVCVSNYLFLPELSKWTVDKTRPFQIFLFQNLIVQAPVVLIKIMCH